VANIIVCLTTLLLFQANIILTTPQKVLRHTTLLKIFVIISNGDTILKKTITKKDFLDKLPQYLKNYAVIFEPKFEGYDNDKDVFDFSFSVSIPLTDVGQLMNLSINRNGHIR